MKRKLIFSIALIIYFLSINSNIISQTNKINIFSTVYLTFQNDIKPLLSPTLTIYQNEIGNSLFSELRYNYDGTNTFGLYVGYSFTFTSLKNTYFEITPQIGYLFGSTTAISPALNVYIENTKNEIFLQSFNPISLSRNITNYNFFLGEYIYLLNNNSREFKIGPALQIYNASNEKRNYIGTKVAFEYRNFELFYYALNFWNSNFIHQFGIVINSKINK